jgi:hypothetical protein
MLTSLTACQNLKELSLQRCAFGADTHDAFKALFGSLTLSKLVIEPTNGRDLTQQVFESLTQQSQLEHFEIGFHPCPRWQLWVPFIEKNVSLKAFYYPRLGYGAFRARPDNSALTAFGNTRRRLFG